MGSSEPTTAVVKSTENLMYSITDYSPYTLPIELLFGKLRSTTEFSRLEELGNGPTSLVFKARDNKNGQFVAFKQFHRNAGDDVWNKELYREMTILKAIDHPNIIKLHDIIIGSDINQLALITDYCVQSVAKFIDTYPSPTIPQSQVKCVAQQMLKGLSYLHKNFIIHRDMKTSNLMITQEGIIKIIDFDSSRRFTHEKRPMTPRVQTRWYQAPEVLLEAPYYDQSIDMWSVGCIIAELLFKKPILAGESELHQINLIIELIGTPTSNIWPGFVDCKTPRRINLKQQNFNKLSEKLNSISCSETLDFFNQLIIYNPEARNSAEECLEHEWMQKAPYPAKSMDIASTMMLTY